MSRTSLNLLGAILGGLCLAAPALAADVTPVAPPSPPAAVVVPVSDPWSSCYLGGTVGGGWGRMAFSNPDATVFAPTGGTFTLDTKGFLAGGQFGCDRRVHGSNLVVGIETSGAWSGIHGSATDDFTIPALVTRDGTVSGKTEWLADITGRIGHAGPRVLIYGKGGVAFFGGKYNYDGLSTCLGLCIGPNPAAFDLNAEETRVGWTVGAGVEWAASAHWSARVEYDYYDFGNKQAAFFNSSGNGLLPFAGLPVDVSNRLQTVKFALNYRLGG